MAPLTEDQEIRAKAIELRILSVSRIAAGALIANRTFSAKFFEGTDLDDIVDYIKTGKKPEYGV